jgi:TPR repeat protein
MVPRASSLGAEQEKLWLDRAEALLREGQIAGARLWLERAAAHGSARASFRLAETYDPQMLLRWGAVGLRSDPGKARDLYAKAYAAGIPEARDRLASVK